MAKPKIFTVGNPREIPDGVRIFVCEVACAECGRAEAAHEDPTHDHAPICGAELYAGDTFDLAEHPHLPDVVIQIFLENGIFVVPDQVEVP